MPSETRSGDELGAVCGHLMLCASTGGAGTYTRSESRGLGGLACRGGIDMGTFQTDVDELERLGGVLHGLAAEAGALRVGSAAGPFLSVQGGILASVAEASSISGELVDEALVPALDERLGETGDVMINVAKEFRTLDEQSAADLAATFTAATGDWNPEEPV